MEFFCGEEVECPYEVFDRRLCGVAAAAVFLFEGEGVADDFKKDLFCFAAVRGDDFLFLFGVSFTACEGIDCLSWHRFRELFQFFRKRLVELVVLEKVVGSLSIAVGAHQPGSEGAVAVVFEDVPSALDPLSVIFFES